METVHLDIPDISNKTIRGRFMVQALIDTGAEVSCISQGLAEALGLQPKVESVSIRITGAGGIIPAITLSKLSVHIRKYTLQVEFIMLPLGATNMILGFRYPICSWSNHYLQ